MDKDIELKILKACFHTFPNACLVKIHLADKEGIPFDVLDKEIIYLVGHGLIECHIQQQELEPGEARYINGTEPVFITSKGIDYLQKNGGFTKMLKSHFATKR